MLINKIYKSLLKTIFGPHTSSSITAVAYSITMYTERTGNQTLLNTFVTKNNQCQKTFLEKHAQFEIELSNSKLCPS